MKKVVLFLASAVLLWGVNLETKTLKSRCENKEAKSCFELGNKFQESKNYQKAGEFYKKACELKHAGACSSVGVLYDMDYIKDVNNKNAAKFYQKGCELNDGFGCARLGFVYTLDKNYKKIFRSNRFESYILFYSPPPYRTLKKSFLINEKA